MKNSLLKIVIATVISIYVFATFGVSVISHYCGGELEKISLFYKSSSCCGEEEEMESDCCKNETVHISFQEDFTFYTLISDCKSPVHELFMMEPNSNSIYLKNSISFFSIITQKAEPPNLVQQSIVSSSVIRV